MSGKKREIHCGIVMDTDYVVIGCREEMEKQVLTQEACELFCEYRQMEDAL